MAYKREKIKGYITVYLALTLGILISFITTMLVGARIQTTRFRTECVMDIGLNSIFAEYHREMLDQYGLLFIDSSYGKNVSVSSAKEAIKSHLLYYMNLNLDSNKNSLINKDITVAHADNAILKDIAFASDIKGEVLRYQIDRYMKVKYGMNYLPSEKYNSDNLDNMLAEYDGYHHRRGAEKDRVDSLIDEYNSTLPEDEEPYSISNPADSVEDISGSNVLYYALGDKNDDFRIVDENDFISHRAYINGSGLMAYQEKPDGLAHKFLLIDYIYDKCGYYGKLKPNSSLSYEIEYIIEGKGSDMENMERIAEKIFKIRYALNMSYLLSSSSKQSEAEALAIAATSAIGLPELTEAVKYTILFAWGYAESAKDLRILYDGHGLTATKNDSSWNTPLEQMIDFKAHLNEYSNPGGEMDYKAFLNLFMASCDTERITMHLMDIMEMDIRRTPGNSAFMMDRQVYQLTADVNVSSGYGYDCSIKRFYSYE